MSSDYEISLLEANNRINIFSQDQNDHSLPTLKAFTFEFDDILELVNRINMHNGSGAPKRITGMRFYLGMKDNPDGAHAKVPCLIFVPVTGFVKGYWHEGKYIPPVPGLDETNLTDRDTQPDSDSIYDFSYPCPPTCASNEIFTAKAGK